MGEVLFLLILAGLDIFYFIETFSYRVPLYDKTGGPAVFPRVILILLLLCITIRIVQILVSKERTHFVFRELFQGSTGVFLFAFAAYIYLIKPLGMIISTILYLGFTSHYMIYQKDGTLGGGHKVAARMAVFVAMSAAIYWFFSYVLNVAVPRGILSSVSF